MDFKDMFGMFSSMQDNTKFEPLFCLSTRQQTEWDRIQAMIVSADRQRSDAEHLKALFWSKIRSKLPPLDNRDNMKIEHGVLFGSIDEKVNPHVNVPKLQDFDKTDDDLTLDE